MRAALLLVLSCIHLFGASYYVSVAGLGGDAEYEAQFPKLAMDLDRQLHLNGPDAHIETLTGATATREHLAETLNKMALQIQPDDAFALFLIGHGTFDGTDYKFNVPGPDISAGTLREWLSHIRAGRQLVVNMTSCSGASLAALTAKNRIVIAATKSGNEKNATVFPRFFIEAMHDSAADTDKDGVTSAYEAFEYAQQKVTAYFATEKLIASEHALFSENGSPGVRDAKQGSLASAFYLLRPPVETAGIVQNPAKKKLIGHKDDLEAKIDRLKYQKSSMEETEYKQQLAALLLDLARTQAEIDK